MSSGQLSVFSWPYTPLRYTSAMLVALCIFGTGHLYSRYLDKYLR